MDRKCQRIYHYSLFDTPKTHIVVVLEPDSSSSSSLMVAKYYRFKLPKLNVHVEHILNKRRINASREDENRMDKLENKFSFVIDQSGLLSSVKIRNVYNQADSLSHYLSKISQRCETFDHANIPQVMQQMFNFLIHNKEDYLVYSHSNIFIKNNLITLNYSSFAGLPLLFWEQDIQIEEFKEIFAVLSKKILRKKTNERISTAMRIRGLVYMLFSLCIGKQIDLLYDCKEFNNKKIGFDQAKQLVSMLSKKFQRILNQKNIKKMIKQAEKKLNLNLMDLFQTILVQQKENSVGQVLKIIYPPIYKPTKMHELVIKLGKFIVQQSKNNENKIQILRKQLNITQLKDCDYEIIVMKELNIEYTELGNFRSLAELLYNSQSGQINEKIAKIIFEICLKIDPRLSYGMTHIIPPIEEVVIKQSNFQYLQNQALPYDSINFHIQNNGIELDEEYYLKNSEQVDPEIPKSLTDSQSKNYSSSQALTQKNDEKEDFVCQSSQKQIENDQLEEIILLTKVHLRLKIDSQQNQEVVFKHNRLSALEKYQRSFS